MNNSILNIIEAAEQDHIFTKSGYNNAPLPSMRKCYTTKLLPFWFEALPSGVPPPLSSVTKSIELVPLKLVGSQIIKGNAHALPESIVNVVIKQETPVLWNVYCNAELTNPGLQIPKGIYQYKITIDLTNYESEPFMCCFNSDSSSGGGDFNNDFNNDFWIGN